MHTETLMLTNPISPSTALANIHYLAIGPWPSTAYAPEIGRKVARPAPACIQIWSLGSAQNGAQGDEQDMDGHPRDEVDTGIMRCELVLCIDVGPAHELKWCPLPSHQDVCTSVLTSLFVSASNSSRLQLIKLHDASTSRRLGYLAGTFQDGSLSIFEVPFPVGVRPRSASTDSEPVFGTLMLSP
jgi:transcription factor C subunit 6